MKVLFTCWANELFRNSQEDLDCIPRVGEYVRFHLNGETPWMRVVYVTYEHFSINPGTLRAHVYLEEVVDPPFIRIRYGTENKIGELKTWINDYPRKEQVPDVSDYIELLNKWWKKGKEILEAS